ncbi:MAG: alpha/beta hydrolase [Myxococcales bacterium]|nr:alpha/beta hydrolase [Myxococcales bacterium]
MEILGDPEAPRSVWFVHGILGQGRNWRSFARRLIGPHADLKAVLPDLRNHGDHPPTSPPHTLQAAATDLQAAADTLGPPSVVVGHSLGGKVALSWLAAGTLPADTAIWVLDSPPGPDTSSTGIDADTDPARVLQALRAVRVPAASREPVRAALAEAGLPAPIVAWLLTSLKRGPEGWAWVYDLDGVQAMLDDYRATNLWPAILAAPQRVQLVRAGASDRWSAQQVSQAEEAARAGAGWHLLANAGHWVHVDAPDATLALLAPSVGP